MQLEGQRSLLTIRLLGYPLWSSEHEFHRTLPDLFAVRS